MAFGISDHGRFDSAPVIRGSTRRMYRPVGARWLCAPVDALTMVTAGPAVEARFLPEEFASCQGTAPSG